MERETVGNILRTLRVKRKLTQVEVAAALDVTRSHLTNVENEKDLAGRKMLMAAADFFGVSLDWLTQRTGSVNQTLAKALNEREALLLGAFRDLPEKEADHLLGLMIARTTTDRN